MYRCEAEGYKGRLYVYWKTSPHVSGPSPSKPVLLTGQQYVQRSHKKKNNHERYWWPWTGESLYLNVTQTPEVIKTKIDVNLHTQKLVIALRTTGQAVPCPCRASVPSAPSPGLSPPPLQVHWLHTAGGSRMSVCPRKENPSSSRHSTRLTSATWEELLEMVGKKNDPIKK